MAAARTSGDGSRRASPIALATSPVSAVATARSTPARTSGTTVLRPTSSTTAAASHRHPSRFRNADRPASCTSGRGSSSSEKASVGSSRTAAYSARTSGRLATASASRGQWVRVSRACVHFFARRRGSTPVRVKSWQTSRPTIRTRNSPRANRVNGSGSA